MCRCVPGDVACVAARRVAGTVAQGPSGGLSYLLRVPVAVAGRSGVPGTRSDVADGAMRPPPPADALLGRERRRARHGVHRPG